MTINEKINLLLRMQLCDMSIGEPCKGCPFDSGETYCRANLAQAAMKALTEVEDPLDKDAQLEDVIADILIDVGVSANGQGYPILVEAVKYLVEDPESVNQATKKLYVHAGAKFGTSGKNAERSMRHSIERAFERLDYDTVTRYFGNSIHPEKGAPTTSEFLARIADIARRKFRRANHE